MPLGVLRRPGRYSRNDSSMSSDSASALSEPLIPNNSRFAVTDSLSSLDSDSLEDDATSPNPSTESLFSDVSRKDIVSIVVVSLLATGGLAAATAAMIAMPSIAVLLMGGLCLTNSPAVVLKQFKIAKSSGVRMAVEMIQKELNLLKGEVNVLTAAVDDLQAETDILIELENDLQGIATKQGMSLNEIINLVNENEDVLEEMKGNLRTTFVTAMAQLVMRSDKDGDMKIDGKEIPVLGLRIQIQLEPYGIKLNAQKFETMIEEDNDISNVMKFLAEMLFEGEIQSGDSVCSDLTFDFETFCKSLSEAPDEATSLKMTYAEKASMVSIDEKFSQGSVEVARGKRMSLKKGKSDSRRQILLKEASRRQSYFTQKREKHRSKAQSFTSFSSRKVIVKGTSAEF